MRYLFTPAVPDFTRVLLVESGSRHLFNSFLPGLYKLYGERMKLDLVTCFAGTPENYRADQGAVYRVTEYSGADGRGRLIAKLQEERYNIVGIVCSAEPLMTKWKWMLALRLPGKLFILNENGDHFWFDRSNWKVIRHFMLFRAGLSGADAVPTLTRVAVFPFALAYLLLFAAKAHLTRKVHS